MTLKVWLKLHRKPEYSGIYAREYLKELSRSPVTKKSWNKRRVLNEMINMQTPQIKHVVFRYYYDKFLK